MLTRTSIFIATVNEIGYDTEAQVFESLNNHGVIMKVVAVPEVWAQVQVTTVPLKPGKWIIFTEFNELISVQGTLIQEANQLVHKCTAHIHASFQRNKR